jgi:simple sugar transport system substrate-binding protein
MRTFRRSETVGAGEHRISRRELLAASAAAGGGVMLAKAGISEAAGSKASPATGPAKTMIGALAYGTCPCVGTIQIGFHNAAELVGWKFQGILSPDADQNAVNLNQTYEQAITAKPAAIGGGMWFPTAATQAAKAIKSGIYFIAVNTGDNKFLAENPSVSYVGQNLYAGGVLAGNLICQQLLKNGKKKGLLLTGDTSPGSVVTVQRYQGIVAGTKAFNKAHGTAFTNQDFPDQSANLAQSLPIYKTKITQVGSDLVALANTSTQTSIANYKIAKELGWKPNQYVLGGFDTDPNITQAIKTGYTLFTLDQQFYEQGFIALMQAWQWLERGFTPPVVYDTGNAIITKANISAIASRDAAIVTLGKRYGIG